MFKRFFKRFSVENRKELEQSRIALQQAYDEISTLEERIDNMKAEYAQLEQGNENRGLQNETELKISFYRELAPLLINYPRAVARVAESPQLLASDLLGMFKPLENVMAFLGIEPIGELGQTVGFDADLHDCATEPEFGTPVSVKKVGYKMRNTVLDRAVVREL